MDPGSLDTELVSEMLSAMGKELKLKRSRMKEVETEAQSLKARADAAEFALAAMTRNFEATSAENHRLRDSLDEMRDTKTGVKQEIMEPPAGFGRGLSLKQLEHSDKSVGTEPDEKGEDHVHSLEQALETYYMKYKSQKDAKHQIRDAFKDLEIKMAELDKRYEEVKQKLGPERNRPADRDSVAASPSASASLEPSPAMFTRQDVYKFMSVLPKPRDRLRPGKVDPIGLNSMDLKSYVAADPQLKEVASNLLCLPGRILWCPHDNVHAIALGPMHVFDSSEHSSWKEGSAFKGLYGRAFHLFYTTQEYVYYGGLYKAIDIRTQCPEGISVAHCPSIVWLALAEAATGNTRTHKLNGTLAKLYCEGALRVEPLGLQCMAFDLDVYDTLRSRFMVVQAAMKSVRKREGCYPEASGPGGPPKTKKQKK